MTWTKEQWRQRRDWNTICATSAGRRKYNLERRKWAAERQTVVFELLVQYGFDRWGVCARIARELSISRATVCRDRQQLFRSMLG